MRTKSNGEVEKILTPDDYQSEDFKNNVRSIFEIADNHGSLDQFIKSGTYWLINGNITDMPTLNGNPVGYAVMVVYAIGTMSILQTIYEYGSNGIDHIFYRMRINDKWTPFKYSVLNGVGG